jgi:Tol biopolymer transport system component
MIGRTILHYEIVEKLGEGGMGVVYKARDTHLDRFVAIKVLPPERVADPERKRRFVQEAKAASALNHPNIITIHDIASEGGRDFMVMEYVAGKTLAELIGRKGLKLNETLRCGVQIADALAAAHATGIVHRDLKPGNVMVTGAPSGPGLVKVLDFGLAKLTEPEPGELAPTQTLQPHTEEGAILGTVAYMSPEQAEGKRVDARSDIFTFGAVLYEMVTGRRAFQRDSQASTLAAILREEPKPVSQVVAETPRELEKVITRCLRKDASRRYQHMDDVKLALEELKEESDSGALAEQVSLPGRRKRLPRWLPIAAGVLLIAAVAAVVWRLGKPTPAARQPSFTQLTDLSGQELFPSLSPDAKSFIYASPAAGKWDIYFQRVGGKNAINLTKDSLGNSTEPAFSPDGERIAFRSDREGGGIFVMGALGESVKRLTDFGFNPAWSPDGRQIVCATENIQNPEARFTVSQLWVVDVATGQKRLLLQGDAVQPHWSPHGYRIAYWATQAGQNDIFTVRPNAGPSEKPVPVTSDPPPDWNPVWSPDGKYLYFSSNRGGSMNLWRATIDEPSGKVLGQPEPVTTPSPYSGHINISRDGRRLVYVQQAISRNIESIAFDPSTEKVAGERVAVAKGWVADLSPDGKSLVFCSFGRQQEDIFVIGVDGKGLRQLTDDPHWERHPRWSPDGKRIAFYSNRSGKYEIWTIAADGSGLQQLTANSSPDVLYPVWSPDGARLAFSDRTNSFIIDPGKPWKEQSPQALPSGFIAWSWSPDGRKIAGNKPEGGSSAGIGIYSLDSRGVDWTTDRGARPVWLSDNRRLLFRDGDKIKLVDSQSRKVREILSVAPNSPVSLSVSRDDRRICFCVATAEADIWLMSLE